MFDPNESGTGHQPMGFDQYATLYGMYRVFKIKYRFVVNLANSTITGARMAIGFQNNATAWSGLSMDAIAEKPRVFVKALAVDQPTTIKGKFYLPRAMGYTSEEYRTSPETSALVNANPVEQSNITIAYSQPSATSQTAFTDLYITYYVEFFDAKALPQS